MKRLVIGLIALFVSSSTFAGILFFEPNINFGSGKMTQDGVYSLSGVDYTIDAKADSKEYGVGLSTGLNAGWFSFGLDGRYAKVDGDNVKVTFAGTTVEGSKVKGNETMLGFIAGVTVPGLPIRLRGGYYPSVKISGDTDYKGTAFKFGGGFLISNVTISLDYVMATFDEDTENGVTTKYPSTETDVLFVGDSLRSEKYKYNTVLLSLGYNFDI